MLTVLVVEEALAMTTEDGGRILAVVFERGNTV
jgi:hypothetical protein